MAAYIIAMVNVTNPDAYKQYAELAGPATVKNGGEFLVRGGKTEILEGTTFDFERVVVSRFETFEQAKKFYNSPEYQLAKSKRLLAADFNMMVAQGLG
jgi:uncharacterized protein (DUF1330 family)